MHKETPNLEDIHLAFIPKKHQTEDICLAKLHENQREYAFVKISTEKLCLWHIDNNKCFVPDDPNNEYMRVKLMTSDIYSKFTDKFGISIDI
jgi:hypothetical protein